VRYLADLAARTPGYVTLLERTVNGQPGLVAQQDGITVTVLAFDITDGRITHIWAVRNPEKLRPLDGGLTRGAECAVRQPDADLLSRPRSRG
jgi:RNA polymerase sigma-70 factor, ECF subfamily